MYTAALKRWSCWSWLAGVTLLTACAAPAQEEPIPLWLDVDTANGVGDVDDGLMMIQAFGSPELVVRGVSVVFGNAELAQAVPIAEEIVRRFGPEGLVVHPGAASAAEFGRTNDAVEAMAAALREAPMHLAAVGPVTNAGTLVQRYPELRERLRSVIVVAARRPGQKFVVSEAQEQPFRDANFEKDVPAMRALLDSGVPIVFAPWEVSAQTWLREADLRALRGTGGSGAWIADTSGYWLRRWRQGLGVDGFTPFDTLAVAWLTHPELIRSMPVKAWIETGPDDGARPVDREPGSPKPYLLVEPAEGTDTHAVYAFAVDPAFDAVLRDRLAGRPGDDVAAAAEAPADLDMITAGFDALLREHVDGVGRVDYAALRENPARLSAYVSALERMDPQAGDSDERLALLINAYNAFTLQLIVDHPGVSSIRDIPEAQRWKARRWSLGGRTVSLDQIEHELIRPVFQEPRIHFALVCAAVDCPPLRPEAYAADRLDAQLEAQTLSVHRSPKHARYDAEKNILRLTPLYDWYGGDFAEGGEKLDGVLATVRRYLPGVDEAMAAGRTPKVEWLGYDWGLNVQPAKR